MLGGFGSSASAGLASGGTIDGDLVVTGDFKVEGAGSFTYDEIIEGTLQVQKSTLTDFDFHADDLFVIERGDGYSNINLASNLGSYLLFSDGTRAQGRIGYVHSSDSFTFGTNGAADVLVIASDGKVGIGATSPIAPLHVVSSAFEIAIDYRYDDDCINEGISEHFFDYCKKHNILDFYFKQKDAHDYDGEDANMRMYKS